MPDSDRMRSFERAGMAIAALAAAACIYVLTENAALAVGIALISLVIAWALIKLEALASSLLGLLLRPLLLPLELLLRLFTGRPRR